MKTNIMGMFLLAIVLLPGCGGSPEIEENTMSYETKTFQNEYDEVWNALEHILVDEMKLPIKINDKERGLLQTDWVSVIRLRGTMRWYAKAILYKEGDRTTVKVSHAAEVPTEVVGGMKDKKGDVRTGWQNTKETIKEVNDILPRLTDALK